MRDVEREQQRRHRSATRVRAVERPKFFYVVKGDAMLKLHVRWAYSPGVGGFSMHAPRSQDFIVCLNLDGGVPFLSSSPVEKGKVTWKGHDYDRLRLVSSPQ
jgi:hypothetical protein